MLNRLTLSLLLLEATLLSVSQAGILTPLSWRELHRAVLVGEELLRELLTVKLMGTTGATHACTLAGMKTTGGWHVLRRIQLSGKWLSTTEWIAVLTESTELRCTLEMYFAVKRSTRKVEMITRLTAEMR